MPFSTNKNCKFLKVPLFVVAVATIAFTIQLSAGAQPGSIKARQVEYLEGLSGLPVEYRADLLLTALEQHHELLSVPAIQTELHALFDAAPHARHRFPQVYAAPDQVDSAESQLSWAFHHERVDAMNIRVRTLRLLATKQPRTAYTLAASMQVNPPPAPCSEASVYEVAPFYSFLQEEIPRWTESKIATAAEVQEQLDGRISTITSGASLAPIASLLATIPLSPEALRQLTDAYAAKELRVDVSSRELGAMLQTDELFPAMEKLLTRMDTAGVPDYPVIHGLRSVLIAGTRHRCTNSLLHRAANIKSFNDLLVQHHLEHSDLTLDEHALDGTQDGGKAEVHSITPTGADDTTLKTLIRYATRADKESMLQDMQGWNAASDSLLQSIELNNDSGNCDLCFFTAKSMRYFLLIENSADQPLSTAKEQALRSYTNFLVTSCANGEDPTALLAHLKPILNYGRQPDPQAKKRIDDLRSRGLHLMGLPTPSGHVVSEEIDSRNEKVTRAYAQFDRLFLPAYESPY